MVPRSARLVAHDQIAAYLRGRVRGRGRVRIRVRGWVRVRTRVRCGVEGLG